MSRKFLWYFIGFAVITAASIIPYWITRSISVFDYIPNETVQIIGKTIIEISGVLIGFWGLILVFILRSFQSYKDRRIMQIHKIGMQIDILFVKKRFEEKAKRKFIDPQIDLNQKWVNLLNQHVEWANVSINVICWLAIAVIAVFIGAILSSMAVMGMSVTNTKLSNEFVEFLGVPPLYMSFPLIMLTLGIVGISAGIIIIAPRKNKASVSKAKQKEQLKD